MKSDASKLSVVNTVVLGVELGRGDGTEHVEVDRIVSDTVLSSIKQFDAFQVRKISKLDAIAFR